jgi:hypothetical protein
MASRVASASISREIFSRENPNLLSSMLEIANASFVAKPKGGAALYSLIPTTTAQLAPYIGAYMSSSAIAIVPFFC